MKRKVLVSIFVVVIALFSLASCKKNNGDYSGIEVVYELNGGIFQNCTLPIKQYYDYSDGAKKIIVDPETLGEAVIEKSGYTLVGWYTDQNFTTKWDFKNDEITESGITLYAKWEKDIKYTYNVCYYDDNNQIVIIDSYQVTAGQKFEDYRNYASKRDGYTPFGFYDQEDNKWDENFTHPGGDEDLAINVFVKYIEGEYALIATKEDFIKALDRKDNFYLLNDIDLENEEIDFGDFVNQIFEGNGFTVKNFKILKETLFSNRLEKDHTDSSKNSAYVSLFGNIENSTIQNVTFENVQFVISVTPQRTYKIYLAPLTTSSKNSKISNVTINVTYKTVQLPDGFDTQTNLVIINDNHIVSSESTEINDVTLSISKGE